MSEKNPNLSASAEAEEGEQSAQIKLQHILVPIDFSASSRKALRYAVSFAQQYRAKVTLVHVVEPPMYPTELGYVPVEIESLNKSIQATAEEKIRSLAEEQLQTELIEKTLVRMGHPYQEITQVARELKVDLIVISTHGYTGLKHVLLGSTAERIVRHAPCPVLTVREREHDFV